MRTEKKNTATRRGEFSQAALEVVSSRGLKGLSIAAVARRVGLVPSALYRHFHGKDDLITAVLDLIRDRLIGNLQAVRAASEADPLESLHRLLMLHIGLIRENQVIPRMILSEEAGMGSPERRRRILAIVQEYLAGVADLIRDGQRKGRIRADLDPATASVIFLGVIQSAGILWHLSDGDFDVNRHAQKAWRTVAAAFAAPAGADLAVQPGSARRGAGKGR